MQDVRMSLDLILVLDDLSRRKIKVNISDLVAYNVNIVSSIKEIDRHMVDRCARIIFLEDYVKNSNFLSELRIYKELYKKEFIYIGSDNIWLDALKEVATCYRMDIAILDYEMLYGIVYNDTATLERFKLQDGANFSESLTKAILDSDNYDSSTKQLALDYNNLLNALQHKTVSEKKLKERINTLERKALALESSSSKIINGYKELLINAREQQKVLEQYEVILTKDVYDKVSINRYTNRPDIIYFKEYEELLHLHSFFETLYEVFRNQAKVSCKVLFLLDSSASKRVLRFPAYYKRITNKFLSIDLISNDFLVKVGDYKKVLDFLLTNRSKLELLIIVDCKDHNDTVLTGSVLHFNMCRNNKYLETYGLIRENTVVNNSDSILSWDTYSNYTQFKQETERFLYLSSRPVIRKIYELHGLYKSVREW